MNEPRTAAPRWTAFLLVAYLAHLCEEWWGGPGLPAWTAEVLGRGVDPDRFVMINAVGFALFAAATLTAILRPSMAWLAAVFAALVVINGVLHFLATVAFSTYSPGTVTGVLLYLPLGSAVLANLSRLLPKREIGRAVVIGAAVHVIASLAALS